MSTESRPRPGPDRAELPGDALLELRDIRHRYGQTLAVADCSFAVRAGEIHGLVGENGSGKSTVVKVLSGVVQPTEGSLLWQGRPIRLGSPSAAQALGIVTVFQETLMVEEMSGRDNIFFGQDGLFARNPAYRQEAERAATILASLGARPSLLDQPAYALSLGQRQVLTIARALARPWKLLILDESTSALDLETRDRLFATITEAASRGAAVLFVSHRMDELGRLIDRSTVLRSGVSVATVERAEASTALYLKLMSGREEAREAAPHAARTPAAVGGAGQAAAEERTVVRCEAVRIKARGRPFDLDVRTGEVLGVAGLDGHGGAGFVSALAGVERAASGRILVRDAAGFGPLRGYRDAFRRGIAFVPGNRQTEGLFAPLSVSDNLSIAMLGAISRLGFFLAAWPARLTREYVARLRIEVADIGQPVSSLSGGNQQKVLVGRWLASKPRVLVMNDPLRGVDQGTKMDFYALLRELAHEGTAVVLLSTEIEEILTVCDRVAVFRDQTVWRLLEHDEMDHDAILSAMFGQSAESSPARLS